MERFLVLACWDSATGLALVRSEDRIRAMRLFGCAAIVMTLMSTASAWASAGMCTDGGPRLSSQGPGRERVIATAPAVIKVANIGLNFAPPDGQQRARKSDATRALSPPSFPLLWCVSGDEAGCYPEQGYPAFRLGGKAGRLACSRAVMPGQMSDGIGPRVPGSPRATTAGRVVVERLNRPPRG